MNYAVLINKSNRIDDNFKLDLVNVASPVKDNILLDKKTYNSFCSLQEYLLDKDIDIQIYSGYRTHEYQANLYEEIKEEKGTDYADKYVARPFTSEHESGLALDFCVYINGCICAEHDIKDYKDLNIIHESLHTFGFILRYPLGKEAITKYNYEPWHIRYVGVVEATNIYINMITLEEYYDRK